MTARGLATGFLVAISTSLAFAGGNTATYKTRYSTIFVEGTNHFIETIAPLQIEIPLGTWNRYDKNCKSLYFEANMIRIHIPPKNGTICFRRSKIIASKNGTNPCIDKQFHGLEFYYLPNSKTTGIDYSQWGVINLRSPRFVFSSKITITEPTTKMPDWDEPSSPQGQGGMPECPPIIS